MKIDISKFRGLCKCGENHSILVDDIVIEKGCINRLPEILQSKPYRKYNDIAVICDNNTYEAAGKTVMQLLPEANLICLSSENLHADEHGVKMIENSINSKDLSVDLLLAVGSGTIHDLTRYVAYSRSLPFFSIPTAASVDGFVSTVAAMTWYGFKKSLIAVSPVFVLADSNIFSKAPYRLTASGISDLFGKYTAIADWKIAHLVLGESICSTICEMEYNAIGAVRENISGLHAGNTEAYEQLMYALILSGLAMQMTGNSRPASGAEHHFSHLWEMHIINKPIDAYHGEKVGVGLMNCCCIYHNIKDMIEANQITIHPSSEIEMDLLQTYMPPELVQEMVKENTPYPLAEINTEELESKLLQIAEIIETIPVPDEMRKMLNDAGCPFLMEDIGLSADLAGISAKLAPYIRSRLTLLKLSKMF